MFCAYCGRELNDMADVCLGCGHAVKNKACQDSSSIGWWWLGFFFPMIGLILWCVWTGVAPLKAKRVGWGAFIGVLSQIALTIIFFIIYFAIIFMLASSAIYH